MLGVTAVARPRRPALALAFALAIVLGLTLAHPATSARADTSTLGDITYEYTPGGATAAVVGYTGPAGPVAIPASVTFGGETFAVTSVENYAFQGTAITAVTFPVSVTSIGFRAFSNTGLTEVDLPTGLLSLGNYAFASSPNLTRVFVPGTLTTIPPGAFTDLPALRHATLAEGIQIIDNGAFNVTGLTTITIPASVTTLGNSTFTRNVPFDVLFDGNAPTLAFQTFGETVKLFYRAGATGFTTPTWNGFATAQLGTVGFDANGGSGTMSSVDAGATLPANAFTRPGYTFTGWSTAADGSGTAYAAGAVTPLSGDATTLYAQWQRDTVIAVGSGLDGGVTLSEGVVYDLQLTCDTQTVTRLECLPGEIHIQAPGAVVDGHTVMYPFDPARVGATADHDIRLEVVADPGSGSTSFNVHVASLATDLRVDLPAPTVDQGGQITVTVVALDAQSDALGDVTDHVTLTSDVPTDVIVGATITFPTASLHTITATTASGLSASATIRVIPTPRAPAALPTTGGDPAPAVLAALALLMLGAALRRLAVRN